MELDVMFKAWSEHSANVDSKLNALTRMKPIHKQALAGAIQIGAVAPNLAVVEVQPHVPAGRVWNLLSVSIFSADAHTPVIPVLSPLFAAGTAAAPAANASISGNTGVASVGTYQLNYTVSVSGTSAVADASNFKLNYGAAAIFTPIANPEPGVYSGSLIYTVTTAGSSFHINNIAAGTAGTVYGAQIQAVPIAAAAGTLPSTFADIYAGSLLADLPVTGGALSDVVVPAAVIPSVNFVPDKAIWLHQDETIYAVVNTPPVNTNYILTARIGEYPVDAVEAMVI